jgi:hypothetical protein
MSGSLAILVVRRAVAFAFAALFLWQVAERAGPPGCDAIVHVTEPDVEIRLDNTSYRVDGWMRTPFVFKLHSGHHTLSMQRGRQLLQELEFSLSPGETTILTAQDSSRVRPARPDPTRARPFRADAIRRSRKS